MADQLDNGWLVGAMAAELCSYPDEVHALIDELRVRGQDAVAEELVLELAQRHYDFFAERVAEIDANADPATTAAFLGVVDGATFVLDGPAELAARWGRDDQVLWASGEGLLMVAPPGVGKTTIAVQLVGSMVGVLGEYVLGYPVLPARKVLYLAMDRPSQIRRAMRRCFNESHRALLEERLVVHPGPLPTDIARDPGVLLQRARAVHADVIVLDSLKDAASKLTDDEAGGQLNRAMQFCLADGIDVLALHHQRKGQNGDKPKTLEDVYGSTWITAGAGSVVLLWGKAGDPLVELHHLKQPAGEVGPLKIEHDHLAGRSVVYRGFDAGAFLRLHPTGVTVMETARAMFEKAAPTDAERLKAQRILDGLVKHRQAVKDDAKVGGDGGSTGARYRCVESVGRDLEALVA